MAAAVTSRHQVLAPIPPPVTAQQSSALADIGRHDPYAFEGLVPASAWGSGPPSDRELLAQQGDGRQLSPLHAAVTIHRTTMPPTTVTPIERVRWATTAPAVRAAARGPTAVQVALLASSAGATSAANDAGAT